MYTLTFPSGLAATETHCWLNAPWLQQQTVVADVHASQGAKKKKNNNLCFHYAESSQNYIFSSDGAKPAS